MRALKMGTMRRALNFRVLQAKGGKIVVTKEALAPDIRDAVEEVFAEVTVVSNVPAVSAQAGFAIAGSCVNF